MKRPAPTVDPSFRRKIFTLGVVCLFLVMIVTALFGKKGVMDLRRARRTLAVLETEVRTLERELAALQSEIERLENDPRAVENAAREKLGLAAPGEKVVVLPRPEKK